MSGANKKLPWMKLWVRDLEYSNNWSGRSWAEKGLYMEALMMSWLMDGLPEEPERFRRVLKAFPEEWEEHSEWLLSLFPVAEDGLRRNPRQEQVRGEAQALASTYTARATNAAEARWSRRESSEDRIQITAKHCSSNASSMTFSLPEPLNTPEILQALESWVAMRRKIKKPLVSQQGYTRAANRLYEVSLGDPKKALEIIARSEENCWKSFFQLPDNNKTEDNTDVWGRKIVGR